jgi:sortase (surface protein transpeptidase)
MVKLTKSNWIKTTSILIFIMTLVAPTLAKTPVTLTKAEANSQQLADLPTETSNTETLSSVKENISVPAVAPVVSKPKVNANGYSLAINAIGLNISLARTSLDSAGHLMVPANPNTAAWYTKGPKPGEAGTALVTGHLDSAAGPGVFINLSKLKAGELIKVGKPDGTVATFRIDRLASYGQDNTFPWNEVYKTSGSAQLRIITCDGVYSKATGHYTRNLVVYATLIQ